SPPTDAGPPCGTERPVGPGRAARIRRSWRSVAEPLASPALEAACLAGSSASISPGPEGATGRSHTPERHPKADQAVLVYITKAIAFCRFPIDFSGKRPDGRTPRISFVKERGSSKGLRATTEAITSSGAS